MADTTAASKRKYGARRMLNPRRVQSLLKRCHEQMLGDSKDPKLTPAEKIAILKAGAEYAKALGAADERKQQEHKAEEKSRQAASKKLPWE